MESLVLVLVDIRSLYNVGSIIRSADGLGVNTIYSCGITPYLNQKDDKRLPHVISKAEKSISKTALGAEKSINNYHYSDVYELISMLRLKEYSLVAIEQSKNSVKLNDYKLQNSTAIFFGNERDGLEDNIIQKMDAVVEIPMQGQKNSLNVSVAAAIAMHELMR